MPMPCLARKLCHRWIKTPATGSNAIVPPCMWRPRVGRWILGEDGYAILEPFDWDCASPGGRRHGSHGHLTSGGNHRVSRQIGTQALDDTNRSNAWATSAVRNGKGFMEIEVTNICTVIAWAA